MCGIGGFSLNKNSTINARSLAHHLLSGLEWRGQMSSGFAYKDLDNNVQYYKDAVAGSNLPLKELPRQAKTVILHTRFATQGDPSENSNNHPVLSPDETIALVHNGVIWNDRSLRMSDTLTGLIMPEVDTAVIPALLQEEGTAGLKRLSGDAAIAWLTTEDEDVLHLARVEGNPITWTMLDDGSIVWASTEYILGHALDALGLKYGHVFNMPELAYYKLTGGVVMDAGQLEQNEGHGYGYAASFRNATSGGHGIGSTFGASSYDDDDDWGEYSSTGWSAASDDRPEVLKNSHGWTESWMDNDGPNEENPPYFTIDTDGNFEYYADLDALETSLLWAAGRLPDDDEAIFGERESKWANAYVDVGSVDYDGDSAALISWVVNPSEISQHEARSNTESLTYVKDGVDIIRKMVA